jgi:hypothetical protein
MRSSCKTVLCALIAAAFLSYAADAQTGKLWPEADRLFHSDPLWLGADAAFSIDLGHGRVLWIFEDSFVARRPGATRKQSTFVHNTVAIQHGYDPSRAAIKFYWRHAASGPAEIFPSEGNVWMWPSAGIRLGNTLLLFAERVTSSTAADSLGFKGIGWNAYTVSNPDDDPSHWTLKKVAQVDDSVIMASAVLRDDHSILLFGQSDVAHDLYAARLSTQSAASGNLNHLQWWTGTGWQSSASLRKPLIHDAGTETSVQRDPQGAGFLEVNSQGFGASDIVLRRAPHIEGPWSAPTILYRPPESDAPDPFVYAGKSHPELKGADLILTYVANGPDEKLATDMSLYFPRFVKVDRPHTATSP